VLAGRRRATNAGRRGGGGCQSRDSESWRGEVLQVHIERRQSAERGAQTPTPATRHASGVELPTRNMATRGCGGMGWALIARNPPL
jgi:hypothetical protein